MKDSHILEVGRVTCMFIQVSVLKYITICSSWIWKYCVIKHVKSRYLTNLLKCMYLSKCNWVLPVSDCTDSVDVLWANWESSSEGKCLSHSAETFAVWLPHWKGKGHCPLWSVFRINWLIDRWIFSSIIFLFGEWFTVIVVLYMAVITQSVMSAV